MGGASRVQGFLTICLGVGVLAGAWWLVSHAGGGGKPEKPAPAAQVAKPVKEEDLATVTLTPEAEARLGLTIEKVQTQRLGRVRVYGGEVMVPIGRAVQVAAPLGGRVKSPPTGGFRAGESVKKGQVVFQLLPLLTPEGRATIASSLVDADGQVNNARTQVEATKIAFERAKRLLTQEAGSRRNVDETQAAYELAVKTFEAAEARKKLLGELVGESNGGTAAAIPLGAPEDGILRNVSVLPDQNVPAGALLFEVVDLSTVWVRVALPVDDAHEVARDRAVQVGPLASQPGATQLEARPVVAPPSANPLASTLDLFYELPNPERRWVPGQRLGVTIPLQDSEESLTAPWSAVVFDIHGGTWVYEQAAPRVFARRRVVVRHVQEGRAVLQSGPPVGTPLLATGALELFGAETGFSK